MRRTIFFSPAAILIGLLCLPLSGQVRDRPRDIYVLLTTPYNIRPLTLFKGQFRIDGGYKFSVRTNSYDSLGIIREVNNKSTGSVFHYYYATLSWGMTDFIELSAETNMIRMGQRDATTTYESVTANSRELVKTTTLTETKGMGDLLIKAALRVPERMEWIDISASGGLYLPVAKHEEEIPNNSITTSNIAATNTVESVISIKENYRYGFGVPVYTLSAALKAGYGKFRTEMRFGLLTPREEGTSVRWTYTLIDKNFSYTSKPYSYLLDNIINYDISFNYQATGWFNLSLNTDYRRSSGGWEERSGIRYANPEANVITVEPGFELQVSPSLILFQTAGFPVAGKNAEAPFWLLTTLKYSFFPITRR